MRKHRIDRRTALLALGAALAGLPGCLGDGTEDDKESAENSSTDDGAEDEHDDDGHEDGHDDAEETGHHEHGHGHGDEHDHVLGEPAETITVELVTDEEGHHFLPHVVHIKSGGTVTWELDSGTHDAVAYHPDNDRPRRMPRDAEPWETDLLDEQGATVERTFDVEGVYDYYCTPHESLGMVARVVVGEPDLHDAPAMAEPQASIPTEAGNMISEMNNRVTDAIGHH